MKTSELIDKLSTSLAENGDLEIFGAGADEEGLLSYQLPDRIEDFIVSEPTKRQLKLGYDYPEKFILFI